MKESTAEIMQGLHDRDTARDADLDRRMSAIANMIAASSINNNNNSNSNSNINIDHKATVVDTPYSSEVEFIPASTAMRKEPDQPGKELFPPSGRKSPNV